MTFIGADGNPHVMTEQEAEKFWNAVRATTDALAERDKPEDWQSAIDELNATIPGLKMTSLAGYVPIQGKGTYEGEACYFHARGQRATFSVGTHREGGDVDSWLPKRQAQVSVDRPYAAGFLTPRECVEAIRLLVANLAERTKEQGEAELAEYGDGLEDFPR